MTVAPVDPVFSVFSIMPVVSVTPIWLVMLCGLCRYFGVNDVLEMPLPSRDDAMLPVRFLRNAIVISLMLACAGCSSFAPSDRWTAHLLTNHLQPGLTKTEPTAPAAVVHGIGNQFTPPQASVCGSPKIADTADHLQPADFCSQGDEQAKEIVKARPTRLPSPAADEFGLVSDEPGNRFEPLWITSAPESTPGMQIFDASRD